MADTYTDPKTGKEVPKVKWVDPGFGPQSPANQIKSHTSGVLGGAHMGGHSDVAANPAPVKKQATMPAAPKKKAK